MRAFVWICLGVLTISPLLADVVYLKNGAHLNGEIVSQSSTSVILSIDGYTRIIPKIQIQRIRYVTQQQEKSDDAAKQIKLQREQERQRRLVAAQKQRDAEAASIRLQMEARNREELKQRLDAELANSEKSARSARAAFGTQQSLVREQMDLRREATNAKSASRERSQKAEFFRQSVLRARKVRTSYTKSQASFTQIEEAKSAKAALIAQVQGLSSISQKQNEARTARQNFQDQRRAAGQAFKESSVTPFGAAARSAVLPGWGIYRSGRHATGIAATSIFVAALGYSLYDYDSARSARAGYRSQIRDYALIGLATPATLPLLILETNRAYANFHTRGAQYNQVVGITGLIYAAQIVTSFCLGTTRPPPGVADRSDLYIAVSIASRRESRGAENRNNELALSWRF